jgi:hypothetical protein
MAHWKEPSWHPSKDTFRLVFACAAILPVNAFGIQHHFKNRCLQLHLLFWTRKEKT